MSAREAPQRHAKSVSGVRNIAVSLARLLDSGELLSGTPTIEEVDTSDLTITNEAVTASDLSINLETVAAGRAVTFRVAGGVAGKNYRIRITASTNAAVSQTLVVSIYLQVLAD